MQQSNILTLGGFRYLKFALALLLVCIALYFADSPGIQAGGGTWLGYGLGTLGAVLILWLMMFGIRKRAYNSNLGTVRAWLSAHVYLGLSLIVITTLHAAFHFGLNIHTLAYLLTLAVVLSGMWGLGIYFSIPAKMSGLLKGKTLEQCAEALIELDEQSTRIASGLDSVTQSLIERSAQTPIFSHGFQRYLGGPSNCATSQSVTQLKSRIGLTKETDIPAGATAKQYQELYTLQLRRQVQLRQLREYLRLKAQTELWLLVHVPMSFALLAALSAHIVSVFFYW
jgi:hypothetical protein